MEEYLCLEVRSKPGESEADFKARLSTFWTHMLRNRESDYEKVYAEGTRFERAGDRTSRKYLIEAEAIEVVESELSGNGLEFEAPDRDDLYSKYEAAPPDWFWIEH